MRKNFDFTAEELMELEALEVRGGRDGGGIVTQTGCINESKGCGAAISQTNCVNKVEGCGGTIGGAGTGCNLNPNPYCGVTVNTFC